MSDGHPTIEDVYANATDAEKEAALAACNRALTQALADEADGDE
ncbi:hypothetical protein [Halarchaeum nitratireducens]|uniref:Uncharacterized protein n=1 Tax=Halarchaeum nitratireducens TaxID=489913 RepID=A0A830GCG7_9EURY|nr:hypothetical protein [Halarchaeum nitratireducens]GGN18541.1 hypothetical protein GCM10009021_19410 [Halarchaeum nitratireducens]